jgi:hypothetical protein
MIYITNRKHYFKNLENAIEKAKEILRNRANQSITNEFKVTKGKNSGYCVTLLDNWEKVGNINLLRVSIQTANFED